MIRRIQTERDSYIRRLNSIYETNLKNVCILNGAITIIKCCITLQSGIELIRGWAEFDEDGNIVVDGKFTL